MVRKRKRYAREFPLNAARMVVEQSSVDLRLPRNCAEKLGVSAWFQLGCPAWLDAHCKQHRTITNAAAVANLLVSRIENNVRNLAQGRDRHATLGPPRALTERTLHRRCDSRVQQTMLIGQSERIPKIKSCQDQVRPARRVK